MRLRRERKDEFRGEREKKPRGEGGERKESK